MKKKINVKTSLVGSILLFVQSLLFIASGFYILATNLFSTNQKQFIIGFDILGALLIIFGIIYIVSFVFINNKRIITTLIVGNALVLLGVFSILNPNGMFSSIVFIMAIWASINFLWRFVLCVQLKLNSDNGFIRAVIDCAISLTFTIYLFINPVSTRHVIYLILGIYFVMFGFTIFGDFIREILKWDLEGKYIKRKIKVRLPVLLTAFLPNKLFNSINGNLNDIKIDEIEYIKDDTETLKTHLEIFIHTSPKIAMGFGHVDICFENTTYSYGTYDEESTKLGGVFSDGVYVKMDRDKYIKHCVDVDNETVVAYSIYLTDEQIEHMSMYIKNFDKNVYEWKCKAELNPNVFYDDPASIFYKNANAKFYKFYKGKFKTYFAVKTNCVQLADMFVGASGIDVISLNGIITPGTYFKYLDNCFKRSNSFVTKKTIYTNRVQNDNSTTTT